MTPRAPSNLNASGRSLWKSITTEFVLDDREARLLELACHQLDHLTDLEAVVEADGLTVLGAAGQTRLHPAVVESRQARIALARLLGQIACPHPTAGRPRRAAPRPETPPAPVGTAAPGARGDGDPTAPGIREPVHR